MSIPAMTCPQHSFRCHVDEEGPFCPHCGWRPAPEASGSSYASMAPAKGAATRPFPQRVRPPLGLDPDELDFGDVECNTTATQTCLIRHGGDDEVKVRPATEFPDWLAISSVEGSRFAVIVNAGRYPATSPDAFQEDIRVAVPDDRTALLRIRGRVVGPVLAGFPEVLDLRRGRKGVKCSTQLTLTNAGVGHLLVREVVLNRPWLAVKRKGGDQSSVQVEITADPDVAGAGRHEGLVRFVVNGRSQQTIDLPVRLQVS